MHILYTFLVTLSWLLANAKGYIRLGNPPCSGISKSLISLLQKNEGKDITIAHILREENNWEDLLSKLTSFDLAKLHLDVWIEL
jgi:hypothetical protein